MQLRPPPDDDAPLDLARGLATRATDLGQRPAVTVLGAAGRAEQGYVTLAQWAAKGAHLLLTDAFVAPGDAVLVDLPPSWQLASVCAAVWWVGAAVVTDPAHAGGVVAGVVHESRDAPEGVDPLYVVGDAVDGGTTGDRRGSAARLAIGSWTEEVQQFPDQPPPAAARPDLPALIDPDGAITHREIVAAVTCAGAPSGTVGLDLATWLGGPDDAVRLVAARPLATGRATLVLTDGLDRAAATGDRVRTWA